jgi:DNA-binding CsgD family transcriptional regulator
MVNLRASEVLAAMAYADALLSVADFHDVEAVLLPGLARITGSDMAVYHLIDLEAPTEIDVPWPWEILEPSRVQAYQALMPTHPLVVHLQVDGSRGRPIRVSDLLSIRQWRATPVYRESHRALGVDDQMAVVLASRGSVVRAVSTSRRGRPYNDRERDLLALVSRHLAAAMRRAHANPLVGRAIEVLPRAEQVLLPAADPAIRWAPPRQGAPTLTPREYEVLDLVSVGLTNGQVARRLKVQPATVKKHLEHAYDKLGVDNRVAAARLLR